MLRSSRLMLFIFQLQLCKVAICSEDVWVLIEQVQAVDGQGVGSPEARAARDKLAAMGPSVLPKLLEGMNTPNLVAANWLRTGFDEVVARGLKSQRDAIPVAEIQRFVLDPKKQGRVRRLALDVLAKLEPEAPARIIPPLLNDPEFRRDAVAVALAEGNRAADAKQTEVAIAAFSKAFDAARDADQIRSAAARLMVLGREVSIVEHMGFLVDWFLIGPFDGPDFTSLATVYPPEQKVALAASYDGKGGQVSWKRFRTPDEFGTVDLVKAVAAVDGAAAYAFSTFDSPDTRDVQIRCGADDNLTIWLNGDKVFTKDEWQNGTRLDRFIVPVKIRKGTNEILVKVCQGPKYRDPDMGNLWSMQLRICAPDGKGLPLRCNLNGSSTVREPQ